MSILGRIFKSKAPAVDLKAPCDFVKGVYRMNVGERSHVTAPYYVEVIEVFNHGIITSIPRGHELEITQLGDSPNWDYHIKRFEYIGSVNEKGGLLYNQHIRHK